MPPSTNSFKTFTDFLQDKQFVHWKLFSTPESEAYWNDFLKQHPHLTPLFRKAEEHFVNIKIEEDTLSKTEKQQLWQAIHRRTSRTTTATIKWVKVAIGACAAIALIILFNNYFLHIQPFQTEKQSELIVGSLLHSEDIRLVSNGNALSFQNNVQVQIDADGKAKIIQKNQTEKTIEIANNALNKLIVPYGKRSEIRLADGTKVWLNSGSTLEFPASFDGATREVHLSGEMYIEVAPDKQKSFHVRTSDFRVKVYGTKFNVSAYADSPQSVVLVQGKVSLQQENKKELFLSPGKQAVYADNGTFTTQKADVNQFISWINGYLEFNKTPMTEVLKQISRYYNLSFDFENDINLQTRTCTGKIYLSENLDNVMTTVGLLSSTKYVKNNNQIVITNDPD